MTNEGNDPSINKLSILRFNAYIIAQNIKFQKAGRRLQ